MNIYRGILSCNPYLFSISKSYLILLSLNLRSLCFSCLTGQIQRQSLLRNLSPVTSKGCADKDNATRRSIARHFATKPVRRIKNCKRIEKTEANKKRKIDNKTMKLLDSLYSDILFDSDDEKGGESNRETGIEMNAMHKKMC